MSEIGQIRWRGRLVFVSGALAGEHVGLEERDEGLWTVSFGTLTLGTLDERDAVAKLIKPMRKRTPSRRTH